ncbi:MAG TPA: cytochrome P450 [Ilumatobacteraceae bacterium]|nr:cytochrome P450 [Ilumatobacteraceae bacterium]
MTTTTPAGYDPLDPAVQADPYPYYVVLRRDDPVQFVSSLGAYVVSRHADVRQVLHDGATFSNEAMAQLVSRAVDFGEEVVAQPAPVSIIGADGEQHARLRMIVNRGFTPRRVALLEREMRAMARPYLDRLVERGAGDLQADFAVPFPTVVIATMLGVDPELRDEFRRWAEHMILAVFEPDAADRADEIGQSGEQMDEWLDSVIAERAGRDGDDLISMLLRAELEGGALSHEELRVFVFTLLVAGSITTAYLIGNAANTLARTPQLAARARADRALIPPLVEESLRHDAPAQMMFRTATRNVELAGSVVPKGATVVALLGSANRDHTVFVDPDAFRIERDNRDNLAFGHGAHYCLGAALARLEARVALEQLLAHASHFEPAGEGDRVSSLVFRGPTHLPMWFR